MSDAAHAIAFIGPRRIAAGPLVDVAVAAKAVLAKGDADPILIFDAQTGRPIDVDFRGSAKELRARLTVADPEPEDGPRGRGRPKLGVTAREVTLLPRHWDWLAGQRGGASATLRRLVEDARRHTEAADAIRHGREALYRFITAMAGDAAGYEEATRALFAGDEAKFEALIEPWPCDVRDHVLILAGPAFGHAPSPLDGLVPVARRAAVRRAIRTAFPGAVVERAERMAWGASGAGVFKVGVGGGVHVLRVEGPPDGFRDPGRQYACLKIAGDAGVAPRLLYGDVEDRVSITSFVDGLPGVSSLTRAAQLQAIVEALRRLHAAPLFPKVAPYLDLIDGIFAQFAASGVAPASAWEPLMSLYARIAAVYPRGDTDLVCSHNDLNPSNVIFEGARPWIVDWEAGCAADRYVDLAALANFFAASEEHETLILSAYFGSSLDAYRRARFFLMQQVNRLFYGVMFINSAVAERPETRLSAEDFDAPRLADVRGKMATLGTFQGRLLFGRVFLNEARQGMQSARFKSALGMM